MDRASENGSERCGPISVRGKVLLDQNAGSRKKMHESQLRTLGELESRLSPENTRGDVIAWLRELGLTDFALF